MRCWCSLWIRLCITPDLRGADTRVCSVETRLDAPPLLDDRSSSAPRRVHQRGFSSLRSTKHRDESRCGSLKAAPSSNPQSECHLSQLAPQLYSANLDRIAS